MSQRSQGALERLLSHNGIRLESSKTVWNKGHRKRRAYCSNVSKWDCFVTMYSTTISATAFIILIMMGASKKLLLFSFVQTRTYFLNRLKTSIELFKFTCNWRLLDIKLTGVVCSFKDYRLSLLFRSHRSFWAVVGQFPSKDICVSRILI